MPMGGLVSGIISSSAKGAYTPPPPPRPFKTGTYTGTGDPLNINTGFQVDLVVVINTAGNSAGLPTWVGWDSFNGPGYWGDAANEQNATFGQGYNPDSLTSFNFNGFSLGVDTGNICNKVGVVYQYFAWKKTEGFFDIQSYIGNRAASGGFLGPGHGAQGIPNNLKVPGNLLSIIGGAIGPGAFGSALSFSGPNIAVSNPFAHILFFPGDAPIVDTMDPNFWPNNNIGIPGSYVPVVGPNNLTNAQGTAYTMYLWATGVKADGTGTAIAKFGTYVGNGSTTGPTITGMGFTPSMVIIHQQLDSTSSNDMHWVWGNTASAALNKDNAMVTTNFIDLVSGGFNVKTANSDFNTTGKTYAYYAWQ